MKNSLAVLIACVLAFSASTAAKMPTRSRARTRPQASEQAPDNVKQAMKRGGLHEAAIAAGGEYRFTEDAAPDGIISGLPALVNPSDVILIGEVLDNECHLSANGKYITTDYRVRVSEPLFGEHPHGATIVLRIMGGRVEFPDGTAAQLNARNAARPIRGERLLLFLRQDPASLITTPMSDWANGAPIYSPVFGPISVVALPENGSLVFKGRLTDPLVRDHRNQKSAEFLSEVKEAIRNRRMPGRH